MKFSVDKNEEGHSFVAGNTKFLRDMTQAELKTHAENGDQRIKSEETEEPKAAKAPKPAPATV